jgi:hypothetical protein
MKQLTENEVNIKTLVNVFEAAFMKVIDVRDESFRVQGPNLKTQISIDSKRKYIRISIAYGLSGNITLSKAALAANTANDKYILTRLVAYEYEGTIGIESSYYMTFEEGLICYQLIKITKAFEEFTVDRLKEFYDDYL